MTKEQQDSSDFMRAAANALRDVMSQIDDMNAPQLRALIAECDSKDAGNCYWLEYRLAPLLKQEAVETLSMISLPDETPSK